MLSKFRLDRHNCAGDSPLEERPAGVSMSTAAVCVLRSAADFIESRGGSAYRAVVWTMYWPRGSPIIGGLLHTG